MKNKQERIQNLLSFSRDLYDLAEKIHNVAIDVEENLNNDNLKLFENNEQIMKDIKNIILVDKIFF